MSRARTAIGAWLVFVVICAIVVARTPFTTDLSAFLPRSPSAEQRLLVDQLREGVVSRLILIGIEGSDTATLVDSSRRLAAQLRSDARFAAIENGENVALDRDRDFVWQHRYVLSPATSAEHFSASALRAALEESLQLLASPAGLFVQNLLPRDPTGELLRIVGSLDDARARPATRDGVWFSRDGMRALLVAQTRARGYDIDAQDEAVHAIRAAFLRSATAPREATARVLLSGPGVFSVASRERIRGDAARISLVATACIAALLLALYRSPRVLVLALLPVATGALAGIAAVGLAFGSVHGVTIGFGATLIGEGVDYAIYLLTQLQPGTPAHESLRRIWPTLRLGVATSICGFSAMLFSGFTGLAQLGLFSIAGLIVAITVTRAVLPALVPARFHAEVAAALAPGLVSVVERAPALRGVALALVALVGVAAALFARPFWTDDLASLTPVSRAETALDESLRRNLGAPDVRYLVVASAPDVQRALEKCESVGRRLAQAVERGVLGAYDAPSLYLPSLAVQRARQSALPSSETLRENLSRAVKGLPFRAGVFEGFIQDVARAKSAPPIDSAALAGTRLELKLESLLVKRDAGWTAMMPLSGVRDFDSIARDVDALGDPNIVVLDLKAASDALYRAYRLEALRNAALGAGAIVLLLAFALRSARRVALVVAPLAAAVVVTAGVIALTGTQLSIFHLVGLLLVVAVGSNYSLFFDRAAAALQDRGRTLVSLVFANLSTVIGFGFLGFSRVPILHAIGLTVGMGAVLSLAFAAVFTADART